MISDFVSTGAPPAPWPCFNIPSFALRPVPWPRVLVIIEVNTVWFSTLVIRNQEHIRRICSLFRLYANDCCDVPIPSLAALLKITLLYNVRGMTTCSAQSSSIAAEGSIRVVLNQGYDFRCYCHLIVTCRTCEFVRHIKSFPISQWDLVSRINCGLGIDGKSRQRFAAFALTVSASIATAKSPTGRWRTMS